MNDLDLLRPATVFAVVVDEGSFRAAAERLNLSAPYVSQLVADLEARLGRQLLYRSTRRIALSADGERFLPVARQMAEAWREGLAAFRKESAMLAGRLRLAAPSIVASPRFARLLTRFQERHPQLELSVSLDDHAVDPLDRQTDLAIRIGQPMDDPRPARLLFRTTGVVCTCAEFAGTIHHPNDLEAIRWIKTPLMGPTISMLKANRRDPVTVTPKRTLVSNSGQLTRNLVASGAGWAVFPEFAIREALAAGELTRALPGWATPATEVYALYSARRTALSNARHFVGFLKAELQ